MKFFWAPKEGAVNGTLFEGSPHDMYHAIPKHFWPSLWTKIDYNLDKKKSFWALKEGAVNHTLFGGSLQDM